MTDTGSQRQLSRTKIEEEIAELQKKRKLEALANDQAFTDGSVRRIDEKIRELKEALRDAG